MSPPVCTDCKFYRRGGFLDIRGATCTHRDCIDKGFTHRDLVTGKETVHQSRQETCRHSRMSSVSACGPSGRLWQQKD